MISKTTRIISPKEAGKVEESAKFVRKHSWGEDSQIDPKEILEPAEFLVHMYRFERGEFELVGLACVTCHKGCPDDYSVVSPFFCCWATHENHRGKGYGSAIYETLIVEARNRGFKELFCTTDGAPQTKALITRRLRWREKGWVPIRPGLNEDCSPFILLRREL